MLRPIPPQTVWQAIAALAGFFTFLSAIGASVDLWRLTVKSHQGEPFAATAMLDTQPDELLSDACFSLGPRSDAQGSSLPLLAKAKLHFDAASSSVEITTDEPVSAAELLLVLRMQCPGSVPYVRPFTVVLPPAVQTREPTGGARDRSKGFHLSLLPGDTVESIAAVLFPGKKALQRELVQTVVAGNPHIFIHGPGTPVKEGTVIWFPDLHKIRSASQDKSAPATKPRSAHIVTPVARAGPSPETPRRAMPTDQAKPVTLRRALELGDKPGAEECKQLMQLCAPNAPAASVTPALEDKAKVLESGIQQLHLKQESIDAQLQRMEGSLQTLQKDVSSAPVPAPTSATPPSPPAPPAPATPAIRTVVETEPLPWYIWAGLASLVILAALGGFAYGRRGSSDNEVAQTDEDLDRMLATAATEMRDLEVPAESDSAPSVPHTQPATTTLPARPPAGPAVPTPAEAPPVTTADEMPAEDALALDVPALNLDSNVEGEPAPPSQVEGLSNEVLYEMDQALDNTRSMFTDVDRFIALGRTQNALSLLQFQVHKDPKDRDSWIKMMAIYRQEKMDVELARAIHEFKINFPNENPAGI